jgi:6-pyruvoyltetrahydropterin/6-carboxytetrahydropterin synthase
MKTTISKEFRFEAAHSLPHLPENHKCHRLHGHSYRIVVFVTGEVTEARGWVIDYADISLFVKPLIRRLDHTNLNELLPISTSERLAEFVWKELDEALPGLCAIEVHETDRTCVRLER